MKMHALRLSVAVVAATTIATCAYADDLAQRLADGSMWITMAPMGGSMNITFRPDGTGRAGSGLFSQDLTWQSQGDRLCLSGLPGDASGCMMLIATDEGFLGRRDDGTEFRLWR